MKKKNVSKKKDTNITNAINITLGVKVNENGIDFSIFSRNATRVWLLIFKKHDGEKPDYIFELDKDKNKFGDIWHISIEGLLEGWYYLWKMDGVYDESKGMLFNKKALLIDPYAKAISGRIDSYPSEKKGNLIKYYSKPGKFIKGIICSDNFNWEGDKPLNTPLPETIIYELHLKGLTAHKSSNVKMSGTYFGVIEKIPYFKELGITALEFLPINEFSAYNDNRKCDNSSEALNNYWGYNTVGFFAPNGKYASSNIRGQQITEFKEMVKALHKANIEVILDIVFNHTAEGGHLDKIINFKGIDNSIYYIINPEDGKYLDYTGCGNTLNVNHPVVSDFILDCLHYWVMEMHVDGFRFDLASALNRDERGVLLDSSPLIKRIEQSPLLRDTKIIAEAWDAGGGYQVGRFKGRWLEWNGKYRDDIRRFWRGDRNSLGNLATRITGSADLFSDNRRIPQQSINFIFSHDGFTLWDWTCYNDKRNIANCHNNEDGENNNYSYNHGVEGETKNIEITQLRKKQAKNIIATLFLSLGTPMINGGDEFLRTQLGNNNPYCQDNEISWFNWTYLKTNREFHTFFKEMIKLRKELSYVFNRGFYTKKNEKEKCSEIEWVASDGNHPDWEGNDLSLGVIIKNKDYSDIFIVFNSNNHNVAYTLPENIKSKKWKKVLDTSWDYTNNLLKTKTEFNQDIEQLVVMSKSLIVLKT